MKKYVKPELVYERFELSQQIAQCEYDHQNTSNDSDCIFTADFDPGFKVFNGGDCNTFDSAAIKTCKNLVEGYCYHSSTGGLLNLHNS